MKTVLSSWFLVLSFPTLDCGPWTLDWIQTGGGYKTQTFVEDRNGKPGMTQGRKAMGPCSTKQGSPGYRRLLKGVALMLLSQLRRAVCVSSIGPILLFSMFAVGVFGQDNPDLDWCLELNELTGSFETRVSTKPGSQP